MRGRRRGKKEAKEGGVRCGGERRRRRGRERGGGGERVPPHGDGEACLPFPFILTVGTKALAVTLRFDLDDDIGFFPGTTRKEKGRDGESLSSFPLWVRVGAGRPTACCLLLVKMAEPAETLGEEKTNKKPCRGSGWVGKGVSWGCENQMVRAWLLAGGGGRVACVGLPLCGRD